MTGVVAIVTGSRNWTDPTPLTDVLDELAPKLVVEGGAKGADELARAWCNTTGVPCVEVPALWDAHGKAAGPKRNELMLRIAKTLAQARNMTVEVVACPLPDSVGTKHMMDLAFADDLCVYVITPEADT
jgi:hypothetical protein